MKKNSKKLRLSYETLQRLNSDELLHAKGRIGTEWSQCASGCGSCGNSQCYGCVSE
jgi:hypothetical protein